MKKKMLIGAAVSVVASLGLWLGFGGAPVAHAKAARVATSSAEVTNGPDTDNVQSGDQSTPDTPATATISGSQVHGQRRADGTSQAGGAESGSETSSGSESGLASSSGSAGGSETSDESDSGSENSSESDGPGGHADPTGDVNHECTGDCQE